ncbi:protein FAM98B [Acanthochromis polyacanthus]|uniref:protein FAM98B n=1 Tax=Acanthochromis polyacanthus TaxID=80966 RepID=UPI0022345590|nr:protein FAM98B [Acanthochromis polyacanthus]
MKRSAGTVSAIKALGYPGGSCLSQCSCDELPCPLLSWLAAELRTLCPELPDSNRTDDILLVGELRNLLSDMSSPLTVLTSEVLEPSSLDKIADFLVSELQAASIIKHKDLHPEEKTTAEESEKEQRVEGLSHEVSECCQESDNDDVSERRNAEMQAEWILLLHALDMDTSSQFEDVLSEVKSRLAQLPCGDITKPLLKNSLDAEQWMQVKKINKFLLEDYQCRRQMMIKRFQVTLESFAWGEKQKERRSALASVPPLASLASSSQVSPSLLLATREDQSFNDLIRAETNTSVYKTLMGSVPDRGGRPGEIEPPMPAWEDRRAKGNRWGQGGGHHQRHKFSGKKKKGKKE